MATRRKAIVCFGEALVDLLAQPPKRPGQPRHFVEYAGGAPANVSVAVARLGGEARFVGMLGQDLFGRFLAAQLHGAGVDIRYVHYTDAAPTALAFVSLDRKGEREFSFYRPPAADLLFRSGDFDPACFADAAVFHVCSNSLTDSAIAETTLTGMDAARAVGAVVSMDLNLRPSLWPRGDDPVPRLWPALLKADLVKLSREEHDVLARHAGSETAMLDRLWQGRMRCLIVTDGEHALHWHTRSASGELPSFPVTPIDTTAAGDAFVGGLLHHLVTQGIDIGEALGDPRHLVDAIRYGSATGALATTRHGAFAAMPDSKDVAALLETSH